MPKVVGRPLSVAARLTAFARRYGITMTSCTFRRIFTVLVLLLALDLVGLTKDIRYQVLSDRGRRWRW
ncbi:hypothetical protein [Nocardia sp. CA-135398]|uniref:hypothetical protein n=1 Tax=Nocardia sp. CA-135398 TaxID=3239977 RepID=UPI003D99DE46